MGQVFEKPTEEQVKKWYNWVFKLSHGKNPFHPSAQATKHWQEQNTDENVIWLAGITATTEPAGKPSQIKNLTAIVSSSQGKTVYNDGNGKGTPTSPTIDKRKISIKKDTRDLYIPVSTEIATEGKYPDQKENLSAVARKIIDREDIEGVPPAFVDLDGKHILNGKQLKSNFRVEGTMNGLEVPNGNIFLMPVGKGKAAFSDYAVILKRDFLTPGMHTLKFGVRGKFFKYEVEYEIEA